MREKIEQQLKELSWIMDSAKANYAAAIQSCECDYKQLCSDLQDKQEILKMALSVAK